MPSDSSVKLVCPLGMKGCEYIENNEQHRCTWYTRIQGVHPQTGEQIDHWSCAISCLPVLQIEVSQTNRGVRDSVSSFRDEMVGGNAKFIAAINSAAAKRRLT